MSEIRYEQVVVGMVVVAKKKEMKVQSIEKKAAIGNKSDVFKYKFKGEAVETGKSMTSGAFKAADFKITVVDGMDLMDGDAESSEEEQVVETKEETKNLADYDMSTGGAGASKTEPIRAGEVRKGMHVIMNNDKPCKVIEISISKTGKHGHAKANMFGLDIFTGRKYNEISPTSHNMVKPVIFRAEWELTNIAEDQLTLQDDNGNQKEDLDLPRNTDGEYMPISEKIIDFYGRIQGDDSKYLSVVVVAAMDKEQVVDCTIKNVA